MYPRLRYANNITDRLFLLIISGICLPVRNLLACYIAKSVIFCCMFDGFGASHKFRSVFYCFIRYLIRSKNFSKLSKYLNYRMTEFCANLYIKLKFREEIFSNIFPLIFTTIVSYFIY